MIPRRKQASQEAEQKFAADQALAARFDELVLALIVNTHVKMRRTADQTWKRPTVSADSAADASEVEAIASFDKFGRAFGIDCDICHQRAPDSLLASAEYRATHPAA